MSMPSYAMRSFVRTLVPPLTGTDVYVIMTLKGNGFQVEFESLFFIRLQVFNCVSVCFLSLSILYLLLFLKVIFMVH